MIKNVNILEPHALQALIETRQHIFARAKIPVWPRPHIPTRLSRNNQLVAIRQKILLENLPERFLRRSVRRPIIICQIKMCDPEIESPPQHGARVLEIIYTAKVVPKSKRHRRKLNPASPRAPILHGVVTLLTSLVHVSSSLINFSGVSAFGWRSASALRS